jgi:glycosyltransferase involved in cell wall biosynthesis
MRFGVVIATTGRAAMLSQTLPIIQACLSDEDRLLLVGAAASDFPEALSSAVEKETWTRGSSPQRNRGIELLAGVVDVIVFFDDDFLPAPDWRRRAEAIFAAQPDVAALCGHIVADGIHNQGYGVAEGLAFLAADAPSELERAQIDDDHPSYGCNMAFRACAIGELRFDERLKHYAWQEDADFSFRVARAVGGRRVRHHGLRGVHLGVKAGRVSGRRLGYAQIVNPLYLLRKGTMPAAHVFPLMTRNLLANAAKTLKPEPWIDRRGRLMGNLRALADVALGRLDPARVETV